jgi:putative acyl-CoA dehydrogenase
LGAGGRRQYAITGHKWFCSAPMSDPFLALARRRRRGVSCFLVPLHTRRENKLYFQRLKSKHRNRHQRLGRGQFESTWAQMVGDEGAAMATVIVGIGPTTRGSTAMLSSRASPARADAERCTTPIARPSGGSSPGNRSPGERCSPETSRSG